MILKQLIEENNIESIVKVGDFESLISYLKDGNSITLNYFPNGEKFEIWWNIPRKKFAFINKDKRKTHSPKYLDADELKKQDIFKHFGTNNVRSV